MIHMSNQAVSGLVSPQQGEAIIRESWPSVTAYPGIARLGRQLICSIVGAPLGWALLLPVYFSKILPFLAKRYRVTNKRLVILRGLKGTPVQEIPLSEIDEVRVTKDDNSDFFRAGNIEIVSGGNVVMTLVGIPEPDSFRHAIINAYKAWVPGKASGAIVSAKAAEGS